MMVNKCGNKMFQMLISKNYHKLYLRVLFETLDRSLYGTPFIIAPFYKGIIFHHITCLNCNNSHGNEEIIYDLHI